MTAKPGHIALGALALAAALAAIPYTRRYAIPIFVLIVIVFAAKQWAEIKNQWTLLMGDIRRGG